MKGCEIITNEIIMASLTFKSKSGRSINKDMRNLSINTLDLFKPDIEVIEKTIQHLEQAGFKIEARTEVGISFSGPKGLFESEFNTKISRRESISETSDGKQEKVRSFQADQPLMSKGIAPYAESVRITGQTVYFHDATPPVPDPNYYHLDVLTDVPRLLNAAGLHSSGITGKGIRISLVDSGFITRVNTTHVSSDSTHVSVDHKVLQVKGVWLSTDTEHTGTDYFPAGSFNNEVITLGKALPGAGTSVEVVYSSLHPHYLAQNYDIDMMDVVGGGDLYTDEDGHGTAIASNVLAVAPGATFSFVKVHNGSTDQNYLLAGFQYAVQNQNPDIITVSMGINGDDQSQLLIEVANAVSKGITVVFAAGNGEIESQGVISHPNLISVGGANPVQGGGFTASNQASSFDSVIYTNPQRHIPDVVGLVGDLFHTSLIMMPTEPGNFEDRRGGDNTSPTDGWCVRNGTSAAAPQVAGVVALLLQKYPNLSPMGVKNILENSALDIQTGSSFSLSKDKAAPGWDPATGFGLVDAGAAASYLQEGVFNAYIRDSVEDNGKDPVVANRLFASPDIIVRTEIIDGDPQDELGQTVKHRNDLSDDIEDGQDNYIYIRVQNRGTISGDCTVTLYFTDPGALGDPKNWKKINSTPYKISNISPGEFRVAGPIVWPDALIPASGHYCLIAVLDSDADPAVNLNEIYQQGFDKIIRENNNLAWKNIDIVDIIPGGAYWYKFYMDGPEGSNHQGELRISLKNYPQDGQVMIKILKRLVNGAKLDQMVEQPQSDANYYTTLLMQGVEGGISRMPFKSNEKAKITVYYTIPANTPNNTYKIVFNVYVDGYTRGSYTAVMNSSDFLFVGNRRTQELHKRDCPWVTVMSPYNKVPLVTMDEGYKRGFDNCAFCIGNSKQ